MAFALRKPPKLTPKLGAYPYQLDAIRSVRDLPYAAIFHEQGLGKTKIAVDVVLDWLSRDIVDTVFIITKKALVQNWLQEFESHAYVSPHILSDNRRSNSIAFNSPVLVYLMNYEVISGNMDIIKEFLEICRVGAVLDESHKIKNPDAKLTCDFLAISEKFERRIIMTGTPVANRPYDLWSQIKFLDGGKALGDSFSDFKSQTDLQDTKIEGSSYSQSISAIWKKLRHFAIRETKQSSGLELPEKIIENCFVDMSPEQQAIYDDYIVNLGHGIATEAEQRHDSAEYILKLLLRLVQCVANPALIDPNYQELPCKFLELQKLIDSFNLDDGKLIIWTSFIDNVRWLSKKLGDYHPVQVHGSLAIDVRNNSITRFKQDSDCKILIATPGAAKEGLTLTVANRAIFYDRSFSLDDYLQAQDRIHRISQSRQCFVYNLIARNTIDEWVDELLYIKYQAAQLAQNDLSPTDISSDLSFDLSPMLNEILNPLTKEQ